MDKVLKLYNKIYKPVYTDIKKYLDNEKNPVAYFNDVVRVLRDFKRLGDDIDRNKYRVPFLVTRKVIREGDFQRTYEYIKSLLLEKERYRKMPPKWRDAAIGKYTKRVLNTRMLKARKKAGKQIRAHMIEVKNELVDLSEQEGFIRYEMINGKKELLKKKVAGKELGEVETVEKKRDREFYVKNGYEYWPFQGEYWLDELGNYHYVGTQSCH